MDCALTISCDLPTQGTVERLMSHLLEDSSGDPTYVEDFLLTHRIFIDTPLIVCSKLLEWYAPLYPFFFPCRASDMSRNYRVARNKTAQQSIFYKRSG